MSTTDHLSPQQPGIKERELREMAKCALCSKAFGHTGLPLFWRVRIERYGVNAQALRRQAGLEMMLGSVALAQVMGPDEDMATPVMDPVTITVCEVCATERGLPIAALAEIP